MRAVLPVLIKPGDLVRTPSGGTARCRKINGDGSREFEDVITGAIFDLRPALVFLLMPAPVQRWKNYKL